LEQVLAYNHETTGPATELITAAQQYLVNELIPTLTDAFLRFQTLVAAKARPLSKASRTPRNRFANEFAKAPSEDARTAP
jgi:hypothetical protein